MEINEEKLDEIVLALLYLTSFNENDGHRAWKGQDWDTMNRIYSKGFISNPKSKAKSVVFTEDGYNKSKELYTKYFAK
jgi:hypothetical protein